MKRPGGQTGPGGAPHTIPAAPLGLYHPDGQPVTAQHCEAQASRLRLVNTARAGEMHTLERATPPDALAHAALSLAARWDVLRLRAWDALATLAHASEAL